MKKFKALAKEINLHEATEHTFGGGFNNINQASHSLSAASDEGLFYIEKQSQLNRINAFLDAFSRKEYMDPRGALGILRAKLNIAGLDFDFNHESPIAKGGSIPEGEHRFQIKRFGGTFGTTPQHDLMKDGFQETDGIEDEGGEYYLVINISTTANGAYHMDTKIEQIGALEAIVGELEDALGDGTELDTCE